MKKRTLNKNYNKQNTQNKNLSTKSKKRTTNSINSIEENSKNGFVQIEKVNKSLSLKIQQTRVAKKMTQKQLAISCNLSTATIQGYEHSTCVPNSHEITKIGKALGIILSNKSK